MLKTIRVFLLLVLTHFTFSFQGLDIESENSTMLEVEPLVQPMVFMQGTRRTRCYYTGENGPYYLRHNPRNPQLQLTKLCQLTKHIEYKPCVVFKVTKYQEDDKIIRHCAVETGSCENLKLYWTEKYNIIWCKECNGDFCNLSTKQAIAMPVAIIGIVYMVLFF